MDTEPVWLLFCARVMMILATAFFGLVAYLFARQMFGVAGGFIALIAFVFNPEMYAHGRVITADMMGAGTFLLSLYALGLLLEKMTLPRTLLLGVAVGLLSVSKNYAALFAPVAFLSLLTVSALRREYVMSLPGRLWTQQGFARVLLTRLSGLLAAALVAWAVLWAFYGFRYAAYNPELAPPVESWDWDDMLDSDRASVGLVSAIREMRLLPEAFVYGVAHILRGGEVRHSFLLGEYSYDGFLTYFPIAMLIKTPVALLFLYATGLVFAGIQLKRWRANRNVVPRSRIIFMTPFLIMIVIYSLIAVNSVYNIGFRYFLPVNLCLVVLLGGLAVLWRTSRAGRVLISAALLIQALECLAVFPHYLSFFNVAVGGPANGYKLLVDSSVDGGQDLGQLSDWLAENHSGEARLPVYLGFLGNESPTYNGVDARYLYSKGIHSMESYHLEILEPGYYVMSATMLQGIYYRIQRPWNDAHDRAYVHSAADLAKLLSISDDPQTLFKYVMHHDPERWLKSLENFEQLRAERLRLYLIGQEPTARINYSIFVYKLSEQDLQNALPFPELGFPEDFPYAAFKYQIKQALKEQGKLTDTP
ncbi:glycosyltransferase family 39 protein [Cerasicoccus frondis]|uniref:glycosyltransferase family 39 protein n=1 Tax=Cerasicoccus frondis TaxID=490090 RepID=UPI002852689F|nr:glycosyltransferase family 39 protein [Cerasicoccus frondis]